MGIVIGVLMLTLGILFMHEIILSIFSLMFGLLVASLIILISIVSFTFILAIMVVVGVLSVIGLIFSILI